MTHAQPRAIGDFRCRLGESPLWHPGEQCLYWLDCPAGELHRFDPVSNTHRRVSCGAELGALLLGDDGALLLFGSEGWLRIWRAGELGPVLHATPEQRGYRFNDACTDAAGRVLCGVRAGARPPTPPSLLQRVQRKLRAKLGVQARALDPAFGLYRLDERARLSQCVSRIGLSNGLDFSPDQRVLYHADSQARRIFRYAYDVASGELSERGSFASFEPEQGAPDGLCVDRDGSIWVAMWGGACVLCFDAAGRRQRHLAMPVRNVTSLAFGGSDYATLYITSAEDPGDPSGLSRAGSVYALQPGVCGRAVHATPLTRSLRA